MDREEIMLLLRNVEAGQLSAEEAAYQLSELPYSDLGIAKLDTHRALRTGFCEYILAEFKTPGETASIAQRLASHHARFIITRADQAAFDAVKAVCSEARYHERARVITVGTPPPVGSGLVAIVAAGTSDLGVAEEAALTAQWMGQPVEMLVDVGVAGLHRLLAQQECLRRAQAIVVVAGMDGALASVVGGLVTVPVIAVPTSVGYGAHFQGLATLLAMLNSCAPGVAVVNIDNGYGAGYMAAVINAQTGGHG